MIQFFYKADDLQVSHHSNLTFDWFLIMWLLNPRELMFELSGTFFGFTHSSMQIYKFLLSRSRMSLSNHVASFATRD